ncbi:MULTISPECIES: DUF3048 domain-containing protein [Virgibacillus]|uniref:Putative lipoprotein YerB n=1 Tax=Virgibacillus massiliensis TaxID=1462526 RepID=A0A024QIC8_9BACI|nr:MULTISPECIES: DUF3048 domain-containing protein [Virgibacillus]EQB36984.1 hypothetical protein M948_11185 [Virgibacillus sp. CM-4]CDQ41716.1 Putative lipoprotein YerB precursor [Virgibacillus massiliensis]
MKNVFIVLSQMTSRMVNSISKRKDSAIKNKATSQLFLIMLVLLLLLSACSDEKQARDNESKDNQLEDKSDSSAVAEDIYPLTGIESNDAVDNRIIGVMINNHSKARPQTGLSQADIVFEILAEGRITRFLALYQSEMPEVAGPVRSAREYYFELANAYNALYLYHGAATFVDQMIQDREIDHLNGSLYDNDGVLFNRESFRDAPHNSYLQLGAVYDKAKEKGYDVTADYEALPFLSEDEDVTGDTAEHVEIVYSNNSPMEIVEYKYDKRSETYTRYNDRKKTVELESDKPIQPSNVFIIETPHQVIDDAGRRAVDMESGGNAYLIQKGVVQKLQWKNKDGRIVPVKDGKTVAFAPGKTWINVIPATPGLEESVTISNE